MLPFTSRIAAGLNQAPEPDNQWDTLQEMKTEIMDESTIIHCPSPRQPRSLLSNPEDDTLSGSIARGLSPASLSKVAPLAPESPDSTPSSPFKENCRPPVQRHASPSSPNPGEIGRGDGIRLIEKASDTALSSPGESSNGDGAGHQEPEDERLEDTDTPGSGRKLVRNQIVMDA